MDKIDKFLDAIEHPDRYTQNDLEEMLHDPEVKEVFDMLDKTKSSLQTLPTPDIEAEWKEFERTHKKHSFHILNLFSRNIAASIAIGVASLAAVAAVVGVSVKYALDKKAERQATEVITEAKDNVVKNDTITIAEENPVKAPETIVFDNEPLKTIAGKIAEYYGYQVEFNNEASESLRLYFRWNQEDTIEEVAERLDNFEQIHIEIKDKTIKID